MRKATGNRLQVTVIIATFILFFLLPTACCLPPVRAADSTPSAEIKAKLEELKKEIASKAAKLKQEVNKKLQNKAYVGKIKTKSDKSLTIISKNGPRIVNMNQDTEFESQVKGKKYSQKLISEEDYIAALGNIDENQVLTAKKIVLLDPKPYLRSAEASSAYTLDPKIYLWGQIISASENLVTLKDRNLKNISVSMDQKIKQNDFVILTGKFNKDIFEADFVYKIPQGGFIKPRKIATPSAVKN